MGKFLVKMYTFLKIFKKSIALYTNILYNQSLYHRTDGLNEPLKTPSNSQYYGANENVHKRKKLLFITDK